MKNSSTYIAAALLVIAGIALGVWYGTGKHVPSIPTATPVITSDVTPTPNMSPAITPTSSPTPNAHPDWKTFTDTATHASFQYPSTLSTKYISLVDWPPKVQVTTDPFTCTQAGSEKARAGMTEQKTINGTIYCLTTTSEGAAGSVYNQYAYAFSQNNTTIILTFSLRFVQCANYDQPAQKECQTERAVFTPDTILDQIAQTVQVK